MLWRVLRNTFYFNVTGSCGQKWTDIFNRVSQFYLLSGFFYGIIEGLHQNKTSTWWWTTDFSNLLAGVCPNIPRSQGNDTLVSQRQEPIVVCKDLMHAWSETCVFHWNKGF